MTALGSFAILDVLVGVAACIGSRFQPEQRTWTEDAMPLQKGRSDKAVSRNIRKLVHEYDAVGTIGASHPASRKKAIRQAVAISLKTAGRSRVQGSGSRGH
jgi:hypothetical protein